MARVALLLLLAAVWLGDVGGRAVAAWEGEEKEEGIIPLPPRWPDAFEVEFDEETYFTFWTQKTSGRYFYDALNNRTRVDRENGIGDRYCGSAYPFHNTPCTHLVRDNMRLLVFPEHQYCCKCCSSPEGCGIVSPDWLVNATYLGRDIIYGITCDKWNKPGLQNNYYWQALDHTPRRITMEYTEQMTFRHDTFKTTKPDAGLFDYPSDMDCSVSCYGLCAVLGQKPLFPRRTGKEEALRPSGLISV